VGERTDLDMVEGDRVLACTLLGTTSHGPVSIRILPPAALDGPLSDPGPETRVTWSLRREDLGRVPRQSATASPPHVSSTLGPGNVVRLAGTSGRDLAARTGAESYAGDGHCERRVRRPACRRIVGEALPVSASAVSVAEPSPTASAP
jgi:hypothetical protein